jgi:hypothetical protein
MEEDTSSHVNQSLKSPKVFLRGTLYTADDSKLISQVELWSVSSHVFDLFGADTEASIGLQRPAELQSLSCSFDQCRLDLLAPMPLKVPLATTPERRLSCISTVENYPFSRTLLEALCRDVKARRLL